MTPSFHQRFLAENGLGEFLALVVNHSVIHTYPGGPRGLLEAFGSRTSAPDARPVHTNSEIEQSSESGLVDDLLFKARRLSETMRLSTTYTAQAGTAYSSRSHPFHQSLWVCEGVFVYITSTGRAE